VSLGGAPGRPWRRVLSLGLAGSPPSVQMLQNDLSPELIHYLADSPGVPVIRRPGVNFSYLGLNLEDPDTADARVRRGLAHAIDRDAILRHLFRGSGRPADGPLPPGTGGATRSCQASPMTPGRALPPWPRRAMARGAQCA